MSDINELIGEPMSEEEMKAIQAALDAREASIQEILSWSGLTREEAEKAVDGERFADDNGDVPSFSPEPALPGEDEASWAAKMADDEVFFDQLSRWEARHEGPDIVQPLDEWRAEKAVDAEWAWLAKEEVDGSDATRDSDQDEINQEARAELIIDEDATSDVVWKPAQSDDEALARGIQAAVVLGDFEIFDSFSTWREPTGADAVSDDYEEAMSWLPAEDGSDIAQEWQVGWDVDATGGDDSAVAG